MNVDTMLGVIELSLLYVLSMIATFWFLWFWSRSRGKEFKAVYAAFAALLWPLFFAYQAIVEFSK
jgi:hypothetical protein